MSTYFGFNVVTMPTTFPTNLEAQTTAVVGQTVNPFNRQSQVFSWGVQQKEVSITLPPMVVSDAQPWLKFFDSCNGSANVFSFAAYTCSQFPYELSQNTDFAVSSTGTTIVLASSASSVNSFYNGQTIIINSGTGAGQSNVITGYVGSTRTATVSTWGTNPDSTSIYVIPRYFRLKTNTSKWTVKTGMIYDFIFEAEEVIV